MSVPGGYNPDVQMRPGKNTSRITTETSGIMNGNNPRKTSRTGILVTELSTKATGPTGGVSRPIMRVNLTPGAKTIERCRAALSA